MTEEEKEKIYRDGIIKHLADAIDSISNSEMSETVKSNKIMKLLRESCIFVNKDYLCEANGKDHVTLDLDDKRLKCILSNEDNVVDWHPIFGNSFGPFNPKEYFLSKFKIIWILKESYIEKESWVKGDRGRHDQAEEYYKMTWEELKSIDGNPTIANLIEISKLIMEKVGEIPKDSPNYESIMKDVMNHICILEVNHFPGLAFNSKESNDKINEWLFYNKSLLGKMVNFYAPNLVILGGKTVMSNIIEIKEPSSKERRKDNHFFNWTRRSKLQEYPANEYYIFDRKLLLNSNNAKVLDLKRLKDANRASIFQDEDRTVWFPWYHTMPRTFNTYWNSIWDNEEKKAMDEITNFIVDYFTSN